MIIKRNRWFYFVWLNEADPSDPRNMTRVACLAIRGIGFVSLTLPDKFLRWGTDLGVKWQ